MKWPLASSEHGWPLTPAGTDNFVSIRNYAVLGSPIAHSKSPQIHQAAYRVLGLDWHYGRHEVAKGALKSFVSDLDDTWMGLSLTMPLKEDAVRVATELDYYAKLTGAVNTLARSNNAVGATVWSGYNTDVFGIIQAISESGAFAEPNVREIKSALIIGSGSTATSAVTALKAIAPNAVVLIHARNRKSRAELRDYAEQLGLKCRIVRNLKPALKSADLTISTLPAGSLDEIAAALINSRRFKPSGALLDVAYEPWPSEMATLWLREALPVISGLEMLIWQAVVQLRIFVNGATDLPLLNEVAVVAAMRHAVEVDSNKI